MRTKLPLGLTIASLIGVLFLCGLGTWQLYRLQWKLGLIARLEHSSTLPAQALDQVLMAKGDQMGRLVSLEACDIKPSDVIFMHSQMNGDPGYHVLAPCPQGRAYFLLDLGFTKDKTELSVPIHLNPIGRLRPFEAPNGFMPLNNNKTLDYYWRSLADLDAHYGYRINANYFIIMDISASKPDITSVVKGLQQGPVSVELTNNHLGYALTWYGLALVLIAFYVAMLRKKIKQ